MTISEILSILFGIKPELIPIPIQTEEKKITN